MKNPLLLLLGLVFLTGCGLGAAPALPGTEPQPPLPAPTPIPEEPPPPVVLSPEQAYVAAIQPTVPTGSLDTAIRAAQEHQLRVLFVGDSITEGGDIDARFTWANQARTLLEAKGAKTFNFALGARRLADFARQDFRGMAQEPSDPFIGFGPRVAGERLWVRQGKSWFDHVAFVDDPASAPNLYFLAFGINDAGRPEHFKAQLTDVVRGLLSQPGHPSVVLVTSEMPSKEGQGPYLPIPAENVRAIAQATREVVAEQGAALVDANRVWQLLVEGVDPVSGTKVSPRYTETDLLGVWPGGVIANGNGYNHPSRLGHEVTYLAATQELLKKILP